MTASDASPRADRPDERRRARGDAGAGLVVGIVLIFAFTFGGLVWLARDVDRGVSNRSAAQSIAFQAARSGTQATSIGSLRAGDVLVVDEAAARVRALTTAEELFASYDLDGTVTEVVVGVDRVSVTVQIVDGGIIATGSGTVRAERAP